MDWTQTFTIIGTILTAIAAFYYIVKEDIKRHDMELQEMRKEFSKRDNLWAHLLQEIYAIKLGRVLNLG